MENNKENKARFFAQYYGQDIQYYNGIENETFTVEKEFQIKINESFLELRPLSEISDEDAIGVVCNILGFDYEDEKQFKLVKSGLNKMFSDNSWHIDIKKYLKIIDYLRSKGYALPFHDLSVEDLINYGWIKLITNGKQTNRNNANGVWCDCG